MVNLPKNTIITPIFRTMYPALFEPSVMKDQINATPKYQLEAIFDPKDIKAMAALVERVGKEEWKRGLPNNFRNPIRDGSEKTYMDEEGNFVQRPEYSGKIFCKFSTQYKNGFAIVDRNKNPLADESLIYPGVYGRAIVTCKPYSTAGNMGVTFYLKLYQLVGGGDRVIPTVEHYLPDDLPPEEPNDSWGDDYSSSPF